MILVFLLIDSKSWLTDLACLKRVAIIDNINIKENFMDLLGFLGNAGGVAVNAASTIKQNFKTTATFNLKTGKSGKTGFRVLAITGIKFSDTGDSYDIKIEIPDNVCMGEVESVLDWGHLSQTEKSKFKILNIKNKDKELKESDKEYQQVIDFVNNINFSIDLQDDIEPDTKIEEGFNYDKKYEDIPDVDDTKQDSILRFILEIDANKDPDLIRNFYAKRRRILTNKERQLEEELAQEAKKLEEEEKKQKILLGKLKKQAVTWSAILLVAIAAAVTVASVIGGPIVGTIIFVVSTLPVIGFFKAHLTSIVTIFALIFGIKKIHDAYKNRVQENHKQVIENKKQLAKEIKKQRESSETEEKSLDNVLKLNSAKVGEEYNLVLKGATAIRMACDYLIYHIEGYKGTNQSNSHAYEYKADKLNITIADPDDVKRFFEYFPKSEAGNVNKLRIQKIILCPSNIDMEIIYKMLRNNITIVSMEFTGGIKDNLVKNSSTNIMRSLSANNSINSDNIITKELIINRYLQNTTTNSVDGDMKLVEDVVEKYKQENLGNIFGVNIKDEQNFKQNLLVKIREAAEIKLAQQADLVVTRTVLPSSDATQSDMVQEEQKHLDSATDKKLKSTNYIEDIKIRKDMQFLSKLDTEFNEKVALPMHAYYAPDGMGVVGEAKQALTALIDIHSGLFRPIENEYERKVLLKRFAGLVKGLGFNEKINYAGKDRRSVASLIAEKVIISRLADNDLDRCKLFLSNFFDCSENDPKAKEIKSCFNKKATLVFELIKGGYIPIPTPGDGDDRLEMLVKDIFNKDETLVDIFYKIKDKYKENVKIEQALKVFQEELSDDDSYEIVRRDCLSFLQGIKSFSEKNKPYIVDAFIKKILPTPNDGSKHNFFLNGFNKLDNENKKNVLNAFIFRGRKAPDNLGGSGEIVVEMLIKIMESSDIIAAVAQTKNGLYSIFSALGSELKYDLKANLAENNFYDFIRDFFIDKPKTLLKNPAAINAMKFIFENNIEKYLSKQNSDLCKNIQESFIELNKSLVNAKDIILPDGSKLKQESIK